MRSGNQNRVRIGRNDELHHRLALNVSCAMDPRSLWAERSHVDAVLPAAGMVRQDAPLFDKLRLVRRGLRAGMTNQAWGGSSLSGEGISFAQVLLSILVVAVPVVLYFVFREEVLALAGLAALLIALNWLWSSAGAAGKVIVVLV